MSDDKPILEYGRAGRVRNERVAVISQCVVFILLGTMFLGFGVGWFSMFFTSNPVQASVTEVIEATITTAAGFVPLWVAWRIWGMFKRRENRN